MAPHYLSAQDEGAAGNPLIVLPEDHQSCFDLAALLLVLSARRNGAWVACEGFLPGATLMLTTDWSEVQGYGRLHALAEQVVAPLEGWVEEGGAIYSQFLGYTTVLWRNVGSGWILSPDFTVQRRWLWQAGAGGRPDPSPGESAK